MFCIPSFIYSIPFTFQEHQAFQPVHRVMELSPPGQECSTKYVRHLTVFDAHGKIPADPLQSLFVDSVSAMPTIFQHVIR
jgi:hypothetical protein